jgi:membrane-associated HD superfamily phosphohydrolase
MLADGCESAVRANRTQDSEDIARVVNKIFQQRLDLGQLTQSGLTLEDIQKIKEAFVRTLKGMYHPRIQYPGDERSNPQPDDAKPKDKPQGRRMVL